MVTVALNKSNATLMIPEIKLGGKSAESNPLSLSSKPDMA